MTAADAGRVGTAPVGSPEWIDGLRAVPSTPAGEAACDLTGTGVDGEPVRVAICDEQTWFLLCFLAPNCTGCDVVWDALATGPVAIGGAELRPVVVIKEDVSRGAGVTELAANVTPVPVVGSDVAWSDYGVLGYPEIVVVDGSRSAVAARTTVFGWEDALVRLDRELAMAPAAEVVDGTSGKAHD